MYKRKYMMTKVEIQVILVNLVLLLVGYVSCADITKLVLKVDAGSAVSFIDLWNMNGQSVGSESDIIFRHGVLDRPFTTNCPLKIYFMINAAYYIQFDQPFSDNTLSFLTAATPSYISQSTITVDVKIVLSPTGKFPFKMELNTDPTRLYAVIYHPSGNIFPKIYHVESSTPVSATIPGDENQFTSSSVLQIKLRYADTCDISDPNSNPLTPSEAIAVLSAQPTTQEETTTTTTTTTEEPTTTVTTTTTTEEPYNHSYYNKSTN
ncbi:hypothetical protein KUTeg_012789 [Tegillarca granosa]|uniref:Uncharacterized protein n=1 Tax=Tegillarca granosa TaxID=220873 RepID=A0ABQ9F0J4_TEGGR|nr:hypothetical protein KUTeg_012789 [Tegillarca granosa]